MPTDQICHPLLGERPDRLLTVTVGEEAQGGYRQVVIGVLEPRPADGGEQEHLGRATPAAGTSARRRPATGLPVGEQGIQMAAHSGRAQPQRGGYLRSSYRPVLQQHPCHRLAGATIRPDSFHNVYVT
jgi:hypothetical protein